MLVTSPQHLPRSITSTSVNRVSGQFEATEGSKRTSHHLEECRRSCQRSGEFCGSFKAELPGNRFGCETLQVNDEASAETLGILVHSTI